MSGVPHPHQWIINNVKSIENITTNIEGRNIFPYLFFLRSAEWDADRIWCACCVFFLHTSASKVSQWKYQVIIPYFCHMNLEEKQQSLVVVALTLNMNVKIKRSYFVQPPTFNCAVKRISSNKVLFFTLWNRRKFIRATFFLLWPG